MPIKIQVTGLPGAGKSTGIRQFLELNPQITHLDIRDYSGTDGERQFISAIREADFDLIAESACGVRVPSTIVRVVPPISEVYARVLARDGSLDEQLLSLLGGMTVPSEYTITEESNLPGLLEYLFKD